jgi:hypothetical protein
MSDLRRSRQLGRCARRDWPPESGGQNPEHTRQSRHWAHVRGEPAPGTDFSGPGERPFSAPDFASAARLTVRYRSDRVHDVSVGAEAPHNPV